MDYSLNFVPKMNHETLISGYRNILKTIYSPRHYYERVKIFLREYKPPKRRKSARLQFYHVRALIKTMWFLGIKEEGRGQYWRLFASTLLRRPHFFLISMRLAVYGLHFRKVIESSYIGAHLASGNQQI